MKANNITQLRGGYNIIKTSYCSKTHSILPTLFYALDYREYSISSLDKI